MRLYVFLFVMVTSIEVHAINDKESDSSKIENMNKKIKTDDILNELDHSIDSTYCNFIDLGDVYFELANCRLNLFKNGDDWAIVFEKFGYNARAGEPVQIELFYFGNCLQNMPTYNGGVTNVVPIEVESNISELISSNTDSLALRGKEILIQLNAKEFEKYGIVIEGGVFNEGEILKYLSETNPDVTRATLGELMQHLPNNLQRIMTIDNWYHEEYSVYDQDNPPSRQKTYQMIAKVLESGDTGEYKSKSKPNTHWSNWLDSGSY